MEEEFPKALWELGLKAATLSQVIWADFLWNRWRYNKKAPFM